MSEPVLDGNEAQYVQDCLKSGWVSTAGPWVNRFEKEFSAYVGTAGAVSVCNGTAALHLALILAGVQNGDEVLVPTFTFIASVNAIRYAGGNPVFMDCDHHCNLDIQNVIRFLNEECVFDGQKTVRKKSGKIVRAIVPVHIFGFPVDLNPLLEAARKLNVLIIEDAAESLGSRYLPSGKMTGTLGDFGCYSFNGNKVITSGGGGMLVCRSPELLAKARYLSTQAKDDDLFYIHHEIGYNYRLTSLQAALGIAQLEKIDQALSRRRENFHSYQTLLNTFEEATLLQEAENTQANYWLYTLIFRHSVDLKSIIDQLQTRGVQARPAWMLNHLQKPYLQCEKYEITQAAHIQPRILNIPSSSNLTHKNIETVVRALKESVS